jgi:Cytochrome b5-like Heme/Steroid binding domain
MTPVTAATLAEHATAESCWIAIDGVVYDVTDYSRGLVSDAAGGPTHPGGPVLLEACGHDATVWFTTRPMGSGTPHSPEARAALAERVVGWLDLGEVATPPEGARSRRVVSLPAASVATAVDLELDHAIGAETNLWLGVAHGIGRFDVSFGHAVWTGESDLAGRVAFAAGPARFAPTIGAGFRFQGVDDADRMGMYAELPASVGGSAGSVGVVPGVAVLPGSDAPVRAGLGVSAELAPLRWLSVVGEVRADDALRPEGGGAVRFHTTRHTFTVGASTHPALAPLERLAGPEGGFSVNLALTRRFGG